jgi:cbb3-type cytochrome oxidase subunit 1
MLELSTPIAFAIRKLGDANNSERRKARLDIWISNWARLAVLVTAHSLKVISHLSFPNSFLI